MKIPPTTLMGVVDNPESAADVILAYYFKSLKHSSVLLKDHIKSFSYDLDRSYSNDTLITNVRESIEFLFNATFETSNIEVLLDNNTLSLNITFDDGGRTFNLKRIMDSKTSKLIEFQKSNYRGGK